VASLLPLLVTMGDAAGIGPEIILLAHVGGAWSQAAPRTVVVGDVAVMRRAAAVLGRRDAGLPLVPLAHIEHLAQARDLPPSAVAVWQPPGLPPGLAGLPWGHVNADCGAAAAACIEAAVQQVLAGQASAVVTAPVHKEALAAAGVPYPGHTEMLQALAGGPPVRMMLANDELRVVLVTIHQSLRSAIAALSLEQVLATVRITNAALQRFGIPAPRIAVAGLNPHAGEGGLFGDEEQGFIGPAVAAAVAEGIQATGPYAPDTVFMRARRGEFDAVVSMIHDHGLIAVKYLGVEQGVNITLGLPFVRTSPDHGTAFDIAGQGVANPASLLAAWRMARRLAGSQC
jgi:4-hydroxythreonine-4-phosphate dehydrogenase